jgi:hypothetical protein
MHSTSHRENILLPQAQLVGISALCVGRRLMVVEEFATPAGVRLLPRPVPPKLPIAAANEGGSSC